MKRAARRLIGVVTAPSASAGTYEDESGPAIVAYLTKIDDAFTTIRRIHSGRI